MVQSIERAMKIVNILISDNRKSSWTLSEISEKAELPQSSVHRLINTLRNHGLVSQSPVTKQYKIGNTWMEIGFWLHEHLDFRDVARPIMERLAQEVQESVYFSMPNGESAIIIDRVDSPLSVRIIDNLGERIPLNLGAANKSMLAFMKEEKAQHIIDQLVASDPEKSKLLTELNKIKQNGYAISYGEKTQGTTSIAAPVLSFDHRVVGSIYINLLSDKNTKARCSTLVEKVTQAAKEVSDQSGKAP